MKFFLVQFADKYTHSCTYINVHHTEVDDTLKGIFWFKVGMRVPEKQWSFFEPPPAESIEVQHQNVKDGYQGQIFNVFDVKLHSPCRLPCYVFCICMLTNKNK